MDTPLHSQPARGRALAPLTLAAALALCGGCSKGGLTGPPECRRLGEDSKPAGNETPLPTARYAELRSSDGSTTIPIDLAGIGGEYRGTGRKFERCDAFGTYYVERIVLTDSADKLVATVRRVPGSSSSYSVRYEDGPTVVVSSFSGGTFRNALTLQSTVEAPKLQSLNPQAPMITTTQGARVTIQSAATASAEDCGIKEMRWYLTSASTTGGGAVTAQAVVQGDSGSATLKIPPNLPVGTYVVEGSVISKQNRSLTVQRSAVGQTMYAGTNINVVTVVVSANPDQDMTAPTIASIDLSPVSTIPCQPINVSLRLKDDKPLPAGQKVPMIAHPLGLPSVKMAFEANGGETLTGVFTVPADAPGGVWLVYPTTFQDAVGNETTVSLSGAATQLSQSGQGVSGVMANAATFTVQGTSMVPQDGGVLPDLGGTTFDMAPQLVTNLLNILADPQPAMVGTEPRVTITWSQSPRLP